MWLQVINKVKVTHQGEGHIKVKVKYLHPFKFYVAHTLCKRVVCIRLKCYLFQDVFLGVEFLKAQLTVFGVKSLEDRILKLAENRSGRRKHFSRISTACSPTVCA